MEESNIVKKTLGALFDMSFSEFITIKMIKFFYIIAILSSAISALVLGFSGFFESFLTGIFTLLIAAPLSFLIMVLWARMFLELVVVVFRIAENTTELAKQKSS